MVKAGTFRRTKGVPSYTSTSFELAAAKAGKGEEEEQVPRTLSTKVATEANGYPMVSKGAVAFHSMICTLAACVSTANWLDDQSSELVGRAQTLSEANDKICSCRPSWRLQGLRYRYLRAGL